MRIVVDAMGSDHYPEPDVLGAIDAARHFPDTIILIVGDEARIKPILDKTPRTGLRLEIVHAAQMIEMTDKPKDIINGKPESSMHIGMNLVKNGQADAFVTAGNTGAALGIALTKTLRRIPGVKRPALTAVIRFGNSTAILLDVGANADCKPEYLAQFALMGEIYARSALGLARPRVGILANGEEEEKGNELVQQAKPLIRALPIDFIGHIEPKDFLNGKADVVVTDGFTGNIMLKSLEAGTRKLADVLRHELTAGVFTKLGAALSRPAFRRASKQIDPNEIGAAPLLGINGIVMIGHGRTTAVGIRNGVGQARKLVQSGTIQAIREGLAAAGGSGAADTE